MYINTHVYIHVHTQQLFIIVVLILTGHSIHIMYINTHVYTYTTTIHNSSTYTYCTYQVHVYTSEFLISFEAWAKLAQKWLVCAPLRIHLEPNN